MESRWKVVGMRIRRRRDGFVGSDRSDDSRQRRHEVEKCTRQRRRRRRRHCPVTAAVAVLAIVGVALASGDSDATPPEDSKNTDAIDSSSSLHQEDEETLSFLLDTTSTTTTTTTISKKKELPLHARTMEEELQLHAEQQHNSNERLQRERIFNQKEQEDYLQFMEWCQNVLGIQTSLEIHTFYYYDYMTAIMTNPTTDEDENGNENDDDDDNFDSTRDTTASSSTTSKSNPQPEWIDPPMIPVRGLRATRNITQGEIIISIPFQALLTVSTSIDQDPVLGRVMGPKARKTFGWTLEQDNTGNTNLEEDSTTDTPQDTVDFFELPLLAMALLHHYKLGTSSPLYPYIHMLQKSHVESMPFLWDKPKRKKQYAQHHPSSRTTTTSRTKKGIQTVARSIRREMKDMYHAVVDTLVLHHPELFGRPNHNNNTNLHNNNKHQHHQQYDVLDDNEWAFSFENFQWAFAMVNSRHWLLPISDLEDDDNDNDNDNDTPAAPSPMMMQPQGSVDGVPPAEMPTDAWVVAQRELDENTTTTTMAQPQPPPSKPKTSYHSFLAPVADLLNFGPPCTRGRYNQETKTFDVIASCDFIPGQEVTFWYSDECEEIIIGNYGFTHPMVPKCPMPEDYQQARDKWKQRATNLQRALEDAYEDMDVMDTELQHVQQVLADCDCCDRQQPQYAPPQEAKLPKQRQGLDDESLIQGNYLRNQDPSPSQIRGGGSGGNNQMERRSDKLTNARPRSSPDGSGRRGGHHHQSGARGRTDDDVERHGVRRMWAGRSGL
ncbi:expressed unknown protein [Seminavis robusta]|uniref:SET domain-containing protein n=1 Tax=Seminavis robusta TaxID=568900 RepID=A0A9N8D9S8_9STRA|nr:expressed unknown protein [Seminavis robusta]|eukprot:Sro6_g005360.1 n/a (776) ;mRNA; f:165726-168053